jgi:outer membrane protein assembly factor BamA
MYKLNYIYKLFFIPVLLCFAVSAAYSQYINTIDIDRRNVFDSLYKHTFFAADLFNKLHIVTKEYVIEDELLFSEDEELFDYDIYETERILRSMNIFSNVSVTAVPLENGDYDIKVKTQDRWSFEPSLLYGTGGGAYNLGLGLREWNFLGTATFLQMDGLYKSENNIGWDGLINIKQRRLFRTPFSLDAMLQSNSVKTDQFISLQKKYLNYLVPSSYGIDLYKSFGDIFYYNTEEGTKRLPFKELNARGFFSLSWLKEDKIYFTVMGQLEKVERGGEDYRQAYDNSGWLLASFSSVSDSYRPVNRINTYLTQDLCVGGYGNAVIGKVFKLNDDGDNLYYLGAQGEKSVLLKNIYLYGQVTGASAFESNAKAKYTYLEVKGIGFYTLSRKWVIASRFRQQTAWNWDARRQLVLDNDAGLRGYNVNEISGDNRIVGNLELRFFPDWGISFLRISGAAFFDIGTAWNQDIQLTDTRWYQSAGIGIRIHNLKSSADNEVIRLDFAFNFKEGKFGKIIISSGQLFSLIAPHQYKLPVLFGGEFDEY